MGLLTEIGASFWPREYPKLSRLPWLRTACVLLLMSLLVVLAIGVRSLEAFALLRGALREWVDSLPEMSVHRGRLTAESDGPVLIESPGALLAVDPEDILDLHSLATDYEAFIVLRSSEIVARGRSTSITSTPYPDTDRPFTTDDLRQFVQYGSRAVPMILLIVGVFGWVWFGAGQLLWATVLSAAAYAMTAGARPRPGYGRLWSIAGHAMIPVVGFSAVNALLGLAGGTSGLGWLGIGAAVVFCVLGVNALLREESAPPGGEPPAEPGARPPAAGGPASERAVAPDEHGRGNDPRDPAPEDPKPRPPLRPIL